MDSTQQEPLWDDEKIEGMLDQEDWGKYERENAWNMMIVIRDDYQFLVDTLRQELAAAQAGASRKDEL